MKPDFTLYYPSRLPHGLFLTLLPHPTYRVLLYRCLCHFLPFNLSFACFSLPLFIPSFNCSHAVLSVLFLDISMVVSVLPFASVYCSLSLPLSSFASQLVSLSMPLSSCNPPTLHPPSLQLPAGQGASSASHSMAPHS